MASRFFSVLTGAALVFGGMPAPVYSQAPVSAPASPASPNAATPAQKFSLEQLDALLAPIALYPDVLLTQLLMATTNPLEIIAASRWLAQGNNKDLKGAALEAALKSQSWDPTVKSLTSFPQVLDTLNQNLEWTQQLGYAMQAQQQEVFDSIQRLRLQAQNAGKLQSTPQQTVRTAPPQLPPGATAAPGTPSHVVVIEPAQPDVVYVPAYNPSEVYGEWPYPSTPPVYYPPPPAYGYGSALMTGLAFGTGVAITAGLWNLATPNWGCCGGGGYGNVNVNVNRWNNVSGNRPWTGGANGAWRPNNPGYRPGGAMNRPGGPVGRPLPSGGLPANAIGRPGVSAPGSAVRPPSGMGPGNQPGIGAGGARPATRPTQAAQRPAGAGVTAGAAGGAGRLMAGQAGSGQMPGASAGAGRPAASQDPRGPARGAQAGAFSGISDGRGAAMQSSRGAQSRQMSAPSRQMGGGGRGGGRGGGGGGRGR